MVLDTGKVGMCEQCAEASLVAERYAEPHGLPRKVTKPGLQSEEMRWEVLTGREMAEVEKAM